MHRVNTALHRLGSWLPAALRARFLCAAVLWVLASALAPALPAGAQTAAQPRGEGAELQVEHTDAGLLLSAAWRMELPTLVENALYQGIAMHFIAEAQVQRPRWYWTDKTVARATRYLRLSYQPLTRRWRLVQSSTPQDFTGLGIALGHSFDTLSEALAAMERIARWRIAEPDELEAGAAYVVHFQFRLDASQLPRPLQFGALGRTGWNVSLTRRVELPSEEAAR